MNRTRTDIPRRRTSTGTRRRLGLVGTTAVLALGSTLGGEAASAPVPAPIPVPDIALNVAKELDRLGGRAAKLDTSTTPAVDCVFGADPEPLTYSTREIVLRTHLSEPLAEARVRTAMTNVGSPGSVTGSETIDLPTVPAAPTAGGEAPASSTAGAGADVTLMPIVVVSVKPGLGENPDVKIVEVARELRKLGVKASPNYLMAPQKDGPVGVLPNGYPEATDVTTPERDPAFGAGVTVFVFDVGAPNPNLSNRPDNLSKLEDTDGEVLDVSLPKGKVDRHWAGHTNVISDVFQTLAPGADVKAVKVTDNRRIVTDVSATRRMSQTLIDATDAPPEVLVASFGAAACDVSNDPADGELVPLGLQGIAEAVARRGDSVLVAAAGNNSTDRKFYPAAFETDRFPNVDDDAVIAVGALDVISAADLGSNEGMWISPSRSGPPADFSNFGPWVDAWAPGHGLPVRHIDGLSFLERLEPLEGRALVDGTSYSTPAAGALIAEQLSRNLGATPLEAWQAIQAAGAPCDEDLGGVAIALESMEELADTPFTGPSECFLPN